MFQEEPNDFSYLENLISNIYQQKNGSPQSLKIINGQTMIQMNNQKYFPLKNQFSQKNIIPFLEPCSNHKNKKAEFYQTEYPWIRFCQSCALNLAICGKKIQKSLSSSQMFNKIKLEEIVRQMRRCIKQCDEFYEWNSSISERLQQYRKWYADIIGQIDRHMNKIMQIRRQLEQSVEQSINMKIKEIMERQREVVKKKDHLIKEKARIECGLVQLISKQGEKETQKLIQKTKRHLQQVSQLTNIFITRNYLFGLSERLLEIQKLFQQKISSLSSLKLNLQPKPTHSLLDFINSNNSDSLQLKTTLLTESQQGPFLPLQSQTTIINTAQSTVFNSALITPSAQLDCKSQNFITQNSDNKAAFYQNQQKELTVLSEKSQNKKQTRVALQLKSRCKSKQKMKVDLNVRQNIQSLNTKKQL